MSEQTKQLPPWAKELARFGVGLVLALIAGLAARYGIQPAPLPPITIQAADGVQIQAVPLK